MSVIPVALRLKRLRERAGLTMADMAHAAGYKTASGYQRYEDPGQFTKKYIPLELTERLMPVLSGKGEPPIHPDEVMALAGSIAPGSVQALQNDLRALPPDKQQEAWNMILRVVRSYKVDLKE
jgi:transcriptional regulator with XRE-family HTH domain